MQFKDFLKHWNKTSGVIMIYNKDKKIPYFIEIKGIFLFKLIKYLRIDFSKYENYEIIFLNDWALINRIVEMKHSKDPVVVDMLKHLICSDKFGKNIM